MKDGMSFFCVVCGVGNNSIVKFLLKNGVKINLFYKKGVIFFFIVCEYGYDSII